MTNVIKSIPSISVKSVGYTAKEVRKIVEASPGEKVFLARLGGQANEKFTGESKHGEFVGFKGLFFAVNKDGERFKSEVAFFPKNLADKISDMFGDGVLEVTVPAADVYATESDKNAAGYSYMCNFAMDEVSVKKAETIANTIFNLKLPNATLKLENKSKKSA